MAIDLKLTGEQKKQMEKFVKPTPQGKLVDPKEKLGNTSGRTLPIRGRE
jgi:hypothetical protein